MTYAQWFEQHASKHERLNRKLLAQNYTQEQIIQYYRFENMVENEPEFCELYKENKKCHDMQELNCYLCACPNFRFTMHPQKHNNKIVHSHCSIESKDGALFEHEGNVHQDCSGCLVPHHEAYISKNFELSWGQIMKACEED